MEPYWVEFNWEGNLFHGNALRYDRAVLIAYSDALGMFSFSTAAFTPNKKEVRLNIEHFDDFEVQTWMSFISDDEKSLLIVYMPES